MKIGELSSASSTTVETIRYYEREGLLPEPFRSEGRFRIYAAPHLERLQFIRRCRALDMSLDEVRVLLSARDAPREECSEVNRVLDEHVEHVSRRIRELRALERELRDLRARCASAQPAERCGILAGLDAGTRADAVTPPPNHLRSIHRRGRS